LLLCFGNLSDRIGAKRAYVLGIALFGVASLLCATAPSSTTLIVARCVQGATAALMLPASMTLIREAFPDGVRRARALGVWAAGGAVASAAGPVLGGVLSTWDWRLIFAINVPGGCNARRVPPRASTGRASSSLSSDSARSSTP
jgi:DHA2 family methylenomycin A resistance protein-like MFS transporter